MKRAALIVVGALAAAAMITGLRWSDEPPARATHVHGAKIVDVGDYLRDDLPDALAVQAAIDAARRGDTVVFPPGTYDLDRPIRFASRIDYLASTDRPTVLRSVGKAEVTIVQNRKNPLVDVTIRGLSFDNVLFEFDGDEAYESVVDVTISDCVFRNGRPSAEWHLPYVTLRHSNGVTVDNCEFLRDRDHPGRGIMADTTRLTVIKDSFFGTTRDLEAGIPNGYFRTAINVRGHEMDAGYGNHDVVVDGNVWRRTPGIRAPENCLFCQDHGLYAWGSQRLAIIGNHADGWDSSPAGGAMKLRNQRDTYVLGNHLKTSGILTYVYKSGSMPQEFQRISIRDNVIDLTGAGGACASYCGVKFWRDYPADAAAAAPESDVFIGGNSFVAGGEITVSMAHGPAFCIEGNTQAVLVDYAQGVQTRDCGAAPDWEEPFAGVLRGDFNGDGAGDFVHLVRDDDGVRWRAHLSDGRTYTRQEWTARPGEAQLAPEYGAHVGDFDGDGRDDLAYAGNCESGSCWRVQLSNDDGLGEPQVWAEVSHRSGETRRLGFHVGDFDGDGRDDLVSRGTCADDTACWRILRSTGSEFERIAAGAGARFTAESARFGIVVGDFDGDGSDDLAYRGSCSTGTPCFRVELAGPDGFTPRDWGDLLMTAGDGSTAHFGLHPTDLNGDGRADLTYVGRCGTDPAPQWRNHLSTGSGFDVSCSRGAPPAGLGSR